MRKTSLRDEGGGLEEMRKARDVEGELGREDKREVRDAVSKVGEETVVKDSGGGRGLGGFQGKEKGSRSDDGCLVRPDLERKSGVDRDKYCSRMMGERIKKRERNYYT